MNLKDATSTSFGLVIAFLLPGLVAVGTFALWEDNVRQLLATFLTAESNVGLFLLVLLAALVIGLEISALRSAIVRFTLRSLKLGPEGFAALADAARLQAFRAATDEHYRYHQCWGGIALVLPVAFVGWLTRIESLSLFSSPVRLVAFALLECVTVFAAINEYRYYVERSNQILEGGSHGDERVGKGQEGGGQEGSGQEKAGSKKAGSEEASSEEKGGKKASGKEEMIGDNGD